MYSVEMSVSPTTHRNSLRKIERLLSLSLLEDGNELEFGDCMFTMEEQQTALKPKLLQFVCGFIDGHIIHPGLAVWLTPLMLLMSEASLVHGVWIAHTVPLTKYGAIVSMILMAVPYAMLLSFLKMLNRMSDEKLIGTEVHSKLRRSVLSLVWISYLYLPFIVG
jgi:hypothetical protein